MRTTDAICLVVVVAILAWDLFAVLKWGREATVSARVRAWSAAYPLIPFLIGMVAGHWFW